MARTHPPRASAGVGMPPTYCLYRTDSLEKILFLDNRAGLRTITVATVVASLRMGDCYRIERLDPRTFREAS